MPRLIRESPERRAAASLAALLLLLAAAPAGGDTAQFSGEQALAVSQGAIGRQLGDYILTDRHGQALPLRSLRGRPLVINMLYTSCYHVCPALTAHLARMVEIADQALGAESYAVLSIGFDTGNDTPQRMDWYARQRHIERPGWHFAGADAGTIEALSADLGFIFFASPKGFDHLSQVTVLDAEGRVYRQIYGEQFPAPQFVEPLKELVLGGGPAMPVDLSAWLRNVRLFCTVYDPSTGRYHFDYGIFVALLSGVLSLGLVVVFLFHSRARRARQP